MPAARGLEQAPVGLAVPVITGHDDRVEVAEQADLVQLGPGVGALPVGDHGQREAGAQHVEHPAHVRVQPKPSPGDAAVELGEEQRQLGQLLRGQPAGVVGLVLGDDGSPDGDRVELGMLLGTVLLLALQYSQVEIAHLMPAQVDTLVGKKMPDCPEYFVHPLVGDDFGERSVHVESNCADVGAHPRRHSAGLQQQLGLGHQSSPVVG